MPNNGKSLKSALRQLVNTRTATVLTGTVTGVNPLTIQVTNDAKLELDEDDLFVPQYLSDRKVDVSISITTDTGTYSTDTMQFKNALKKGEEVYLLCFDGGQLYYVLDRTGG